MTALMRNGWAVRSGKAVVEQVVRFHAFDPTADYVALSHQLRRLGHARLQLKRNTAAYNRRDIAEPYGSHSNRGSRMRWRVTAGSLTDEILTVAIS
jgi:hypothetical protein